MDGGVTLEHALHDHKVQLAAQVVHLKPVHAVEASDEGVRVLHHVLEPPQLIPMRTKRVRVDKGMHT